VKSSTGIPGKLPAAKGTPPFRKMTVKTFGPPGIKSPIGGKALRAGAKGLK